MVAEPTPAAEARIEAATAQAVASEMSIAETRSDVSAAAIEHAEARVEAAERVAEELTLAAMNTRLGQSIEELSTRCEARWTAHDQIHSSLQSTISTLELKVSELEAKILAMLSTEPPAMRATTVSSSPDGSPQVTAVEVAPADLESGAPMPENPAVPAKRRPRLI